MKRLLFVVVVSATWIHAATALTTRQGLSGRPSKIDARSGQVWFASFSYEDAWQDGRIRLSARGGF